MYFIVKIRVKLGCKLCDSITTDMPPVALQERFWFNSILGGGKPSSDYEVEFRGR